MGAPDGRFSYERDNLVSFNSFLILKKGDRSSWCRITSLQFVGKNSPSGFSIWSEINWGFLVAMGAPEGQVLEKPNNLVSFNSFFILKKGDGKANCRTKKEYGYMWWLTFVKRFRWTGSPITSLRHGGVTFFFEIFLWWHRTYITILLLINSLNNYNFYIRT